jgi:hypothetical protein
MMNRILALGIAVVFCSACAEAQDAKRSSAKLDKNGLKVSVEYGSPTLRGRDIESMISPGDEWRMGADSATTLTTETPLKFGDKVVPQGVYVLRAKLAAPREWLLILGTEQNSRVAEVPLKFEQINTSAESMKISLDSTAGGGRFVLQWGKLALSTDFSKG